jgi:membrane-associated protease RseP (regulator of RpoE activity)
MIAKQGRYEGLNHRRVLLGGACVLFAACATSARAAPPDAAAAPRPKVVRLAKPAPGEVFVLSPEAGLWKARRGHLGLQLTELTPELREHFGAPRDAGVLVAKVTPDGSGARAGVRVGDVLTAIDGEKVGRAWDASRRIRDKADKSTATLEVVRNRGRQTLKAEIEHKEVTELDVGDFMWQGGDWQGDPKLHLDTARIHDAVKSAMRTFDEPKVRALIERRRETEDKLQERTRALEERIEKLEKQLQQKK